MNTAIIEGYAAIFNQPDLSGDIIRPGAFREAILKRENTREKLIHPPLASIKMLYQHAADRPVGRWLSMREDKKGLFVRGELLLDNHHSFNLWQLLKGKALDGLSIGFQAQTAQRKGRVRELRQIDLWEVSIVTFPMMPAARITKIEDASTPLDRLASLTKVLQQGEKTT